MEDTRKPLDDMLLIVATFMQVIAPFLGFGYFMLKKWRLGFGLVALFWSVIFGVGQTGSNTGIMVGWYGLFGLLTAVHIVRMAVEDRKSPAVQQYLREQELESLKAKEEQAKAEAAKKKEQRKARREQERKRRRRKEALKRRKREALKQKAHKSQNYNGFTAVCNSCDYLWSIRKKVSLPAVCPRCRAAKVGVDWPRTFKDKRL